MHFPIGASGTMLIVDQLMQAGNCHTTFPLYASRTLPTLYTVYNTVLALSVLYRYRRSVGSATLFTWQLIYFSINQSLTVGAKFYVKTDTGNALLPLHTDYKSSLCSNTVVWSRSHALLTGVKPAPKGRLRLRLYL